MQPPDHRGLDAADAEARQMQRSELVPVGARRQACERDMVCRQGELPPFSKTVIRWSETSEEGHPRRLQDREIELPARFTGRFLSGGAWLDDSPPDRAWCSA